MGMLDLSITTQLAPLVIQSVHACVHSHAHAPQFVFDSLTTLSVPISSITVQLPWLVAPHLNKNMFVS